MSATWRIDGEDDVPVVRCAPLENASPFAHGFSLRRARGDAFFDLGTGSDRRPEVAVRRNRFLRAAGLGTAAAGVLRQVHGSLVVRLDEGAPPEADGGVWERGRAVRVVPAVRTADCVGILLADRRGRACAAIHAGWRGTTAGIAAEGLRVLRSLGVPPGDLVVALGPAILGCCYEVGAEVADAVGAVVGTARGLIEPSEPPGRFRLDLHLANRIQLERGGVSPEAIHEAPWCTHCRGDLFFSYRREGEVAGRQMAAIGPAAEP